MAGAAAFNNSKGAAGQGGVGKVDDDTLNPVILPPLNPKGGARGTEGMAGAAAFDSDKSAPAANEPQPCGPVATGGLLSGLGLAARAMQDCPD